MNSTLSAPQTINVCIVEDDSVIREGFALLINSTSGFRTVQTYSSCEDALLHLQQDNPDVVLMDIELPGMTGIEGITKIKKIRPQTNIIVITVYENDDLVFKALCAGAGGYLTKNMPPSRLLDAIQEIQNGGAPMSTNVARMVVQSFQKNRNSPLTSRETEVLELLAKGKSYSTIADELFVDKETIRTHIKNIYWKLEVHSKAEAIEKATKERLI
ncbi:MULTISPECIES: response regulator transcription factor [unclassified Siphonobacter]|uniref:response regulator n=1 Tax=unclassified Siphonobacter TaxID=2635712 RepID=UPI000CC6454A|nr:MULTISPECIES: response regulator transcription factor [unclassified Siphonobacter]MDQ1089566.1 DNA-binding NarL/FixJ family response regulator [Siphonobacter sp. SORGH_AS_1065]MDR6195807.1 DNA-binding NarL/FixJ family response regulator [Siphonobacter sp. SORGH_AS_0500]PKK37464.1 DNA-binding response regulator [Siphonobacter sp. SORGH_AS_0500]